MADGAARRPRHRLPVEFCQVGAGGSETRQNGGGEKQAEAQIARAGADDDPRGSGDSWRGSRDSSSSRGVPRFVRRAAASSGRNRAAAAGERLSGEAFDSAGARLSGRNLSSPSGGVPLLSHLLRIRGGSDRAARSGARRMAGFAQDRALPSISRRRVRPGPVTTLQL